MNYIIIDADKIQQRIDELIKESNLGKSIPSINSQMAESLIKFKQELLSNSTPLIPEIEKAMDAGMLRGFACGNSEKFFDNEKEDYISQLKIN